MEPNSSSPESLGDSKSWLGWTEVIQFLMMKFAPLVQVCLEMSGPVPMRLTQPESEEDGAERNQLLLMQLPLFYALVQIFRNNPTSSTIFANTYTRDPRSKAIIALWQGLCCHRPSKNAPREFFDYSQMGFSRVKSLMLNATLKDPLLEIKVHAENVFDFLFRHMNMDSGPWTQNAPQWWTEEQRAYWTAAVWTHEGGPEGTKDAEDMKDAKNASRESDEWTQEEWAEWKNWERMNQCRW